MQFISLYFDISVGSDPASKGIDTQNLNIMMEIFDV